MTYLRATPVGTNTQYPGEHGCRTYIASERRVCMAPETVVVDGRMYCEAHRPDRKRAISPKQAATTAVVKRVIMEVAGTIATNGIQDLDKTERGGVSQFGYVRACLMSTAYNALRAMPNFGDSYNAFCNAVLAQVEKDLVVAA